MSVADIPGLITGAHKNLGLGFSFLQHIQRCTCLLYVIDLSYTEPWTQYKALQYELEQYQQGLSTRPCLIVANKIDLSVAEKNLEVLKAHVDLPVLAVSAAKRIGLEELMIEIRELYERYEVDSTKTDAENKASWFQKFFKFKDNSNQDEDFPSEYGWIVILIFFSMDEFSVWCEQYLLDVLLYMFMQVFIWQMFSAVFSVVHCFIVYCQSALRQFVNAFWFLLGIVIHIIKSTMDKRSSSKKLKNLAKLDKFTIYRSDALINVYIITKTGIQTNIISQRYKNLTSIEVILLWTLNWNWRK